MPVRITRNVAEGLSLLLVCALGEREPVLGKARNGALFNAILLVPTVGIPAIVKINRRVTEGFLEVK